MRFYGCWQCRTSTCGRRRSAVLTNSSTSGHCASTRNIRRSTMQAALLLPEDLQRQTSTAAISGPALPLERPAVVWSMPIEGRSLRRCRCLGCSRRGGKSRTRQVRPPRRFCREFRPLNSRFLVSAGVSAFEWPFLALRLCIQKFRSRRPFLSAKLDRTAPGIPTFEPP
jgi:hypothetical protein